MPPPADAGIAVGRGPGYGSPGKGPLSLFDDELLHCPYRSDGAQRPAPSVVLGGSSCVKPPAVLGARKGTAGMEAIYVLAAAATPSKRP